jgi:hypothetical protein
MPLTFTPTSWFEFAESRPVERVGNELVTGAITRDVWITLLGHRFHMTPGERTYRWLLWLVVMGR